MSLQWARDMAGQGGEGEAEDEASPVGEEPAECPIICEILDPRTQKTIAGNKYVSLSSDFCQTNKLVAQIVAMISEERSVKTVLDELLGVSGCTFAVFPATRYAQEKE